MTKHPYRPGQANGGMTRNMWTCCDRPADEHPSWAVGTAATIRLKRDVTTSVQQPDGTYGTHTFRKGTTIVNAERGYYEPLYVIDEWARDDAERFTFVTMPDYSWETGERSSVSIPWHIAVAL